MFAASAVLGCSTSLGGSILPSVDTGGAVSIEGRLSLSAGLTDTWPKNTPPTTRTAALLLAAEAGSGLRADEQKRGCLSAGGGLGYAHLGPSAGSIGAAASALSVGQFCKDAPNRYGGALQLTPLLTLWQEGEWDRAGYVTAGPLLEAALLDDLGPRSSARARFALGPSVQWYSLGRWTIAM